MAEEVIESQSDTMKRELFERYMEINWSVARLSMNLRGVKINDIISTDAKLKRRISDFVMLASFNEGFNKKVEPKYLPYLFEKAAPPYQLTEYVIWHAKKTMRLWLFITKVLREEKILVIPSE